MGIVFCKMLVVWRGDVWIVYVILFCGWEKCEKLLLSIDLVFWFGCYEIMWMKWNLFFGSSF